MANIKTPHGAAIIWNYRDRLGFEDTSNSQINNVNEIVLSTASLLSISTQKSKSSPVGKFQIVLAPTKNWVSAITAGSWVAIIMSQTPIGKDDLPQHGGKANPSHIKMIGKIETVRMDLSSVNQDDGARNTHYVIEGSDWGYIFENILYIDEYIDPDSSNIGNTAYKILMEKIYNEKDGSRVKMSPYELIKSILKLMSENINFLPNSETKNNQYSTKDNIILGKDPSKVQDNTINDILNNSLNRLSNAIYDFKIPQQMVRYLRLGNRSDTDSTANLITIYSGSLKKPNKYTPLIESVGYLNPVGFRGQHSIWQLILDHCNPVLNETYADLMWDNGIPQLGLVNRIKPFSISDQNSDSNKMESFFNNVKKYDIDINDVLTINAGTNWRDKFNFVEIRLNISEMQGLNIASKIDSQEYDLNAFQREGFRPLIANCNQYPVKGDVKSGVNSCNDDNLDFDPKGVIPWKQLLRKWYFDTHKMLNGTVVIAGQNRHIEVGSNIMIPAKILGPTYNMKSVEKSNSDLYFLAHVESINNNFTSNGGVRSFITTINFIRGIIVDKNCRIMDMGHLDDQIGSSKLTSDDVRNNDNVLATSHSNDPDSQKLMGKVVKK